MDTVDVASTKRQAMNEEIGDGQKGDVKMTEDEKTDDALSNQKEEIESTNSSLSCAEELDTCQPVLFHKNAENNSCQQRIASNEGKTCGTMIALYDLSRDASKTSENKIKSSLSSGSSINDLEPNLSFKSSNEQLGLNEITASDELSHEQLDQITASDELNTWESKNGENIFPTSSLDETKADETILERNSNSVRPNASIVNEESLWKLRELASHQCPWTHGYESNRLGLSERLPESESEEFVSFAGQDRDGAKTATESERNENATTAMKEPFSTTEETKMLGNSAGVEPEVTGVDFANPEVKEETEDEDEFETGSSGGVSEEEDEDAKYEQNICEYRAAFQRVVSQMLSERRAREAAESKLYIVDAALDKCVSQDLANLRLALMHVQLLLRERNRARDDIVRNLQDKDELNKLLEERVLILENQKYELEEEVTRKTEMVQDLERNNHRLMNTLKHFGIQKY